MNSAHDIPTTAIKAAYAALLSHHTDHQCTEMGIDALREGSVFKRVAGAQDIRAALRPLVKKWRTKREDREKLNRTITFPTLRQRIESRTINEARNSFASCSYKVSDSSWAGGDHNLSVAIGTSVSASGGSERAWSTNGKWSGTNSWHKISIRLNWIPSVKNRGLAVVDDMFTLEASPVAEKLKNGESACRAAWIAQGRGFDLNVERGILYRRGNGAWQHAGSLAAARAQANKREKAELVASLTPDQREKLLDLVTVEIRDARSAGLCQTGIDDWRNRHAPDVQSLPARQLLKLAEQTGDRIDLVRRAIDQAIRRVVAADTKKVLSYLHV